MRYTGLTPDDKDVMLKKIGVNTVEELFRDIPDIIRIDKINDLPEPHSEIEAERDLSGIAENNRPFKGIFLGAGAYNHYIPAVVDEISSRSEFYTSYTPYQPEVSQGTLAAIFEFQTMMCRLSGMDITNASMYDGATALAESALMAIRVNNRSRILVSRGVHPHYREVLLTYSWASGFTVGEIPVKDGETDFDKAIELADDNTSAIIIQ
jgi:glycine dehydrogenase subunit 1